MPQEGFVIVKKKLYSYVLLIQGMLALCGQVIPAVVYAWTAVFVLPINSALNPFLYTLTAIISKKVNVQVQVFTLYLQEQNNSSKGLLVARLFWPNLVWFRTGLANHQFADVKAVWLFVLRQTKIGWSTVVVLFGMSELCVHLI